MIIVSSTAVALVIVVVVMVVLCICCVIPGCPCHHRCCCKPCNDDYHPIPEQNVEPGQIQVAVQATSWYLTLCMLHQGQINVSQLLSYMYIHYYYQHNDTKYFRQIKITDIGYTSCTTPWLVSIWNEHCIHILAGINFTLHRDKLNHYVNLLRSET